MAPSARAGLILAILGSVAGAHAPAHDRAFWEALKQQDFRLANGQKAGALAMDALDLLESTDADLRDGIGYEALAAWIYRDEALRPQELERLRLELMVRAQDGLGESTGDKVFGRSFAVLGLSLLAAEDLRRPFMGRSAFEELLKVGLSALGRERDLRGYVENRGWAHATAHAADLLKFLGRNSQLTASDGNRIVGGIVGRLQSAGLVFVWGEDARLAAALRAVAVRDDVDVAPFNEWCGRVRDDYRVLWTRAFDVSKYIALRAQLNTMAELASVLPANPSGRTGQIVQSLRAVLADAG